VSSSGFTHAAKYQDLTQSFPKQQLYAFLNVALTQLSN